MRLVFLNDFYIEKNFAEAGVLFPFWEQYMYANRRLDSTEVQFTKGEVLAVSGNNLEAIRVLQAVKSLAGKRRLC